MPSVANPFVLGLVVILIMFVLKRIGWAKDGPQSMWMTWAFALILATAELFWTGGWQTFPTWPAIATPEAIFAYIGSALSWLGLNYGAVMGWASAVYATLRHSILEGKI